jgi:uracil-DNA glycosylase family protein
MPRALPASEVIAPWASAAAESVQAGRAQRGLLRVGKEEEREPAFGHSANEARLSPSPPIPPALISRAHPVRMPHERDAIANTATKKVAPTRSLAALRREARDCRACPLWAPATQTVFGEGPESARILVIGEQPGDQEDLSGHPFVGPSGQLFDRALEELGIDRRRLYVTNVVKHFKFEQRGKRRLHKRANAAEQAACRPWLDAEIARVDPAVIVCLGAMAAQAILGRGFGLMRERGRWVEQAGGRRVLATVHPSFLLRQRGDEERHRAYAEFVRDLSLLRG